MLRELTFGGEEEGKMPVRARGLVAMTVGIGLILVSLGGCASDPPKPAPTVTPDQVRGHADKTFDKLKQEEQNRAADPAYPR